VIVRYTAGFHKKARKLCQQPKSKEQLRKQLKLFQINPNHPGLRLHKLRGQRSQQCAMWIEGNVRALFIREGHSYIFFDIIDHDQY
jgi:hypothetical protein